MADTKKIQMSIDSKSNTAGIDTTTSAVKKLGKESKDTADIAKKLDFANFLNTAKMVGGIVKGAFEGISNIANQTLEAFSVQQSALNNLAQGIQNNNNLTQDSFQNIIDLTSQLQSTSMYGDEALQEQASYLAGMGLTEQQIGDILDASVNLASTGMMPLDSAVKNISKSLSGQAGEIANQVPALRNLTAEQLKAGEGIALIQQQFAGFAENAADSLAGRQAQFNNLLGDIKEKIGGVFGVFKQLALEKGLPILDDINKWLDEAVPKIINFFLNFPKIAGIAFTFVKNMMATIFTLDFWKNYFDAVGGLIVGVFKATLEVVWNLVKAIGTTLWEPIKYGFELFIYDLKTLWNNIINVLLSGVEGLINFLLGGINKVIGLANSISNFLGKGNVAESVNLVSLTKVENDNPRPTLNSTAITDAWKNVGTSIIDSTKQIVETYKASATQVLEPFADDFNTMVTEVGNILGADLPADIQAMLQPTVDAIGTAADTLATASAVILSPSQTGYSTADRSGAVAYRPNGETTEASGLSQIADGVGAGFSNALSGLGGSIAQVTSIITNLVTGNTVQAVIDLVMLAVDSLLSVISGPLMTIVDSAIKIIGIIGEGLGNAILPLLEPLIPILDILGMMMSTILIPSLDILMPFIQIAAGILQVLVIPILKALTTVITVLMSPIKYLGDLFKWVAEKIRIAVHNFNEVLEHPLNAKNRNILANNSPFSSDAFSGLQGRIDAIWAMPSTTTAPLGGGSSVGGSSASYTGQRDITINFNFDRSFVNGDAQDIAIALKKEIMNAEKLGLI